MVPKGLVSCLKFSRRGSAKGTISLSSRGAAFVPARGVDAVTRHLPEIFFLPKAVPWALVRVRQKHDPSARVRPVARGRAVSSLPASAAEPRALGVGGTGRSPVGTEAQTRVLGRSRRVAPSLPAPGAARELGRRQVSYFRLGTHRAVKDHMSHLPSVSSFCARSVSPVGAPPPGRVRCRRAPPPPRCPAVLPGVPELRAPVPAAPQLSSPACPHLTPTSASLRLCLWLLAPGSPVPSLTPPPGAGPPFESLHRVSRCLAVTVGMTRSRDWLTQLWLPREAGRGQTRRKQRSREPTAVTAGALLLLRGRLCCRVDAAFLAPGRPAREA